MLEYVKTNKILEKKMKTNDKYVFILGDMKLIPIFENKHKMLFCSDTSFQISSNIVIFNRRGKEFQRKNLKIIIEVETYWFYKWNRKAPGF